MYLQWDVLCKGEMMQKIAEVTNGRDNRNCASLLRVIYLTCVFESAI